MSDIIKAGTKTVEPYVFSKDLKRVKQEPLEGAGLIGRADETDEGLSAADRRAEEILRAAREEADAIYEEARRKGYEDGKRIGRDEGLEEARREHEAAFLKDRGELKAEIETCIAEMEKEKERLLDLYLEDLRDIAVAIAEKVIRISLKTSSETMKLMIVSATAGLRKREWVRIHISKYSVDMMMEGDAEFLNALSYLSDHVKIIKMGEEEGTCIVELPDEIIDLSVNTQMANIRELLENS